MRHFENFSIKGSFSFNFYGEREAKTPAGGLTLRNSSESEKGADFSKQMTGCVLFRTAQLRPAGGRNAAFPPFIRADEKRAAANRLVGATFLHLGWEMEQDAELEENVTAIVSGVSRGLSI